MPNWAKEEACFVGKKDMSGRDWPRTEPPEQLSYKRWLADVLNPQTQEYYVKDLGNGQYESAHYDISTIIRFRNVDNNEYLLTMGRLVGYTSFGNKMTHDIRHPEKWTKTVFNIITTQDPTNPNRLIHVTNGPDVGAAETVFSTPFNKENLKLLVDQRRDDHIQFIVKDGRSDAAHDVPIQRDIASTVKLFTEKDFDYLFNGIFVPFEVRERNKIAAEAQGLAQQ